MRVAFISTNLTDPGQIHLRGYRMARAFEQWVQLENIGPLTKRRVFWLLAMKHVFYNKVLRKTYTANRDPLLIKDYARQIRQGLTGMDVDIVFSPVSPGSQPIAYLDCEQPIVFWTDATIAGAMKTHPWFHPDKLAKETYRAALAHEKAALERCSLAIYATEWAAQSALQNYSIDPERVKVVTFGADIDCDRTMHDIETIVDARATDVCKLMLLGTDWYYKGGDVALAVTEHLNQSGLRTELTVIGCQPPLESLPDYVKALGYISKRTAEGRGTIDRVLAESHFLILPTRADAAPLVFNEACSFGTPCIATDVGGVSTIVRDEANGKVFPLDSDPAVISGYIADLFSDQARYRALALSAFNEYETRLNWNVATQRVAEYMRELIT